MGGPMIGMMMKNKITTILTIARLSRRNRRSESCKGVGAFWAVVVVSVVSPSARTSASGIVSAATGWLAVARNSASRCYSGIRNDYIRFGVFRVHRAFCPLLSFDAWIDNGIQDVRNEVSYHHCDRS